MTSNRDVMSLATGGIVTNGNTIMVDSASGTSTVIVGCVVMRGLGESCQESGGVATILAAIVAAGIPTVSSDPIPFTGTQGRTGISRPPATLADCVPSVILMGCIGRS